MRNTQYSAYEAFAVRRLMPGESGDVFLADLRRLSELFGGVPKPALPCAFMAGLPNSARQTIRTGSRADEFEVDSVLVAGNLEARSRQCGTTPREGGPRLCGTVPREVGPRHCGFTQREVSLRHCGATPREAGPRHCWAAPREVGPLRGRLLTAGAAEAETTLLSATAGTAREDDGPCPPMLPDGGDASQSSF